MTSGVLTLAAGLAALATDWEPVSLRHLAVLVVAAIYAVTHVDFVPTFRQQGEEMLQSLAVAGRRMDGNARFDVFTQAPLQITVPPPQFTPQAPFAQT